MPALANATTGYTAKLPAGNFALNRLETIGGLAIEAERRGTEIG